MKRKSKNENVKGLDIAAAISGVTKEKSISMDLVIDTLKDALSTAAKRHLNKPATVEAKVDREKGLIEVYTRQMVAEVVVDPETQITLTEAKTIDPELEVGDEVIQDLDIDLFGRTAIQDCQAGHPPARAGGRTRKDIYGFQRARGRAGHGHRAAN